MPLLNTALISDLLGGVGGFNLWNRGTITCRFLIRI